MMISATCSHCGGDIVSDTISLVIEGHHQGLFHPGCLRQVRDGETISELKSKIEELSALIEARP